jgi:hypothetical protein
MIRRLGSRRCPRKETTCKGNSIWGVSVSVLGLSYEYIPQETSSMDIIGHAHHHYRPRRGKCPSGLCPPRAHPNAQWDRRPAATDPAVGFDTRTKAIVVVVVPSAYLNTWNPMAGVGRSKSMRRVVVGKALGARIHGACGFVAQTLAQNERLRAGIF